MWQLMAFGFLCELISVVLLAADIRGRAKKLRAYESTVTAVARTINLAWDTEKARPITPKPLDVEQRLDLLAQRIEDLRDAQHKELRATATRLSEGLDRRIAEAERELSDRLGGSRDVVVGTGRTRAAVWALGFLLVGLLAQIGATLGPPVWRLLIHAR